MLPNGVEQVLLEYPDRGPGEAIDSRGLCDPGGDDAARRRWTDDADCIDHTWLPVDGFDKV